ncbi:hypothetical protein A3F03_00440 [Candidatus Roizmanbacteria bacterium RIFCSPHIGHO2_12_FULL_41_11]|uniref:Trehalase n=1 Tax=Candidatus Roizmanbacteria bacterium RIFCSPHIGHO2_12_FULL_41_11 TaxID=1802052 RepID=A0A1F7I5N5_9BACT|nr:MAG: hypothetical protein A3F03_00440 [Candidatus Roizmanbacteria bacterium RIFCSPHIGHO2_12_FULL_41_11]
MDSISQLRLTILGKSKSTDDLRERPEKFDFLGVDKKTRTRTLLEKTIPKTAVISQTPSEEREKIFSYIINFWERSLLEADYLADTGKGLNLSKRPFLAPSRINDGFNFAQQYRWDTYFQNKGLIIAGGYDLAIDQLINIVEVFSQFKRVPNALTTWFLSHSQPPLEIFSAFDLLAAGVAPKDWLSRVIQMVEEELVSEWWDYESGKQQPRQTKQMFEKYGLMTRYNSIHFHPLLDSCEDGKDHHWVTATYGANYLPVQINAIIYGILDRLVRYYSSEKLGNDQTKTRQYAIFRERLHHDFNRRFWCKEGKWTGFRNYSLIDGEGFIRYGDLAAEVWPLFVGLASKEQAEVTKNNLERYYAGDYGLASTSLALREGGSLTKPPAGYQSFQWEYPNCWPPLMLVAVEGLKKYGYLEEARKYEHRWVQYLESAFKLTGFFTEKQPSAAHVEVNKGYYGNIKGFGWTISVYLDFLKDLALSNNLDF